MASRPRLARPVLCALIGLLLSAACASPTAPAAGPSNAVAPEAPRVRKHITAAIMSDPSSITSTNSLVGVGGEGVDVLLDAMHAGLSIMDGNGELRPRLAPELPSLENGLWKVSADGTME